MTGKIPVGATIAKTYGFAFGDFLSILGVLWFPAAILAGAGYFLNAHLVQIFQGMQQQPDPMQVLHALPFLLPFYLLVLLLIVMQYVGVTELALGIRSKRTFFYFSLGKPFWRVIAAWIVVVLILIAVEIGLALVIGILSGIATVIAGYTNGYTAGLSGVATSATHEPSGIAAGIIGIIIAITMIVVYGAMLYASFRLTFLLTPAVIAEKKIAIARSWSLSKGNFWRMFVILLAVVLPLLFIITIAELVVIFPMMGQTLIKITQHQVPPEQILQSYVQIVSHVSAWALAYWYILFPVGLVLTVIYLGLSAGMHAFAYRALVPLAADETKAEA